MALNAISFLVSLEIKEVALLIFVFIVLSYHASNKLANSEFSITDQRFALD